MSAWDTYFFQSGMEDKQPYFFHMNKIDEHMGFYTRNDEGCIYRSHGGKTIEKIKVDENISYFLGPLYQEDALYMSGIDKNHAEHIYRSEDDGKTWKKL